MHVAIDFIAFYVEKYKKKKKKKLFDDSSLTKKIQTFL